MQAVTPNSLYTELLYLIEGGSESAWLRKKVEQACIRAKVKPDQLLTSLRQAERQLTHLGRGDDLRTKLVQAKAAEFLSRFMDVSSDAVQIVQEMIAFGQKGKFRTSVSSWTFLALGVISTLAILGGIGYVIYTPNSWFKLFDQQFRIALFSLIAVIVFSCGVASTFFSAFADRRTVIRVRTDYEDLCAEIAEAIMVIDQAYSGKARSGVTESEGELQRVSREGI